MTDTWEGRRVLVTGGAGFVGSRVAHELIAQGAQVVILDDLFTGQRALIPPSADFVEGSVEDLDLVDQLVRNVDVVFHLAARNIILSTSKPREDMAVNIGGTLNVLLAAREHGTDRVVYASSASIYGNTHKHVWGDPQPYEESDAPVLLSPYAVSKLAGEHYGKMFHTLYDVPVSIVRYSNVYGPGQSPDNPYCGVIGAFFTAAMTGGSICVYGDGEQTRDYTFVDDTVRATLMVGSSAGTVGECFNVGTGVGTSVNALADLIQATVGKPVPIIHLPKRDIDTIPRRVVSTYKLAHALGWSPNTLLRKGLTLTYQWMQESVK